MTISSVKKFDLLSKYAVARIRESIGRYKKDGHWYFPQIEYGTPEFVTSSGRARCRCCGEKIAKGEEELKFAYDFHGCGSWTATESHMHTNGCTPAASY